VVAYHCSACALLTLLFLSLACVFCWCFGVSFSVLDVCLSCYVSLVCVGCVFFFCVFLAFLRVLTACSPWLFVLCVLVILSLCVLVFFLVNTNQLAGILTEERVSKVFGQIVIAAVHAQNFTFPLDVGEILSEQLGE
jgi:hypothetical protein